MKNYAIMIAGAERTGGCLCARAISMLLNGHDTSAWWGSGPNPSIFAHRVYHHSIPYWEDQKDKWDPFPWLNEFLETHKTFYVFTTRDNAISIRSKKSRFGKSFSLSIDENNRARKLLFDVHKKNKQRIFWWSYETFMFFKEYYLEIFTDFIKFKIEKNALNERFKSIMVDLNPEGQEKYLKEFPEYDYELKKLREP